MVVLSLACSLCSGVFGQTIKKAFVKTENKKHAPTSVHPRVPGPGQNIPPVGEPRALPHAMADTTEEQKKAVVPFLQVRQWPARHDHAPPRSGLLPSHPRLQNPSTHTQRAQEIERVEPKIAYYCRMYAVEQGLALPARSPQIDGLLGALLSKLEKDKPLVQPGTNDAAYCEKFALGVFARADKVDRAGRADKATATAFYAASIFFEV